MKLRLGQVKQLVQSDTVGIPAQFPPGPLIGVKIVDSEWGTRELSRVLSWAMSGVKMHQALA